MEPNFRYNSKPLKKPALLWALQFQFNCEIYPIVQISSLKVPIHSQWIQASSSKSISFLNVRGDFHIYTARQSPTFDEMTSKWCFLWQCEYGCLHLHIEIEIFLQKYLFYSDCLDSCWSIVVKKWNDMPSRKGLSN